MLPLPFRPTDHPYTTALLQALDAAEVAWPEFRREILALDAEIWPAAPPVQGFETVVAVSASGVRWFIGDPRKHELAAMRPPATTPEVVEKPKRRSWRYLAGPTTRRSSYSVE